jgi:hypothetical protein
MELSPSFTFSDEDILALDENPEKQMQFIEKIKSEYFGNHIETLEKISNFINSIKWGYQAEFELIEILIDQKSFHKSDVILNSTSEFLVQRIKHFPFLFNKQIKNDPLEEEFGNTSMNIEFKATLQERQKLFQLCLLNFLAATEISQNILDILSYEDENEFFANAYIFISNSDDKIIFMNQDYFDEISFSQLPENIDDFFVLFKSELLPYSDDRITLGDFSIPSVSEKGTTKNIFSYFSKLFEVYKEFEANELSKNFELYNQFFEAIVSGTSNDYSRVIAMFNDCISNSKTEIKGVSRNAQKLLTHIFRDLLKEPSLIDYEGGYDAEDDLRARTSILIIDEFDALIFDIFKIQKRFISKKEIAFVFLILSSIFARLSSSHFFGSEVLSPIPLRNIGLALLNKAIEVNPELEILVQGMTEENFDDSNDWRNKFIGAKLIDGTTAFSCTETLTSRFMFPAIKSFFEENPRSSVKKILPFAWSIMTS